MNSRVSLSASEKIGLLSNLSTMLSAGIPLLEAINSSLEDTKGPTKKVLETLKADLMQGKSLYDSFGQFPRVFDKVTLNLIKAAEEAGTLETTLRDLREHIQKETEFIDKIKFAMIYPMLILCLFAGVLLVILVVVIPKISTVFSRLKVTLPLPTRILIFASDILLKQTWYFLGGAFAVMVILFIFFKTNRRLVLEVLYRLPLISHLIKQIDLTRFSRNMFLLLSSGLPIVTALELSQEVVLRAKTAKIITLSKNMISSGKKLSEGLRTGKGYIPSLMIKLIESGEKSGSLDKSMGEIANYLDYQVSNSLKTITAVMEPVLLVVVGISVGAMMISIISPIYGLIGQVGNR
ncbi:MAG: Uncharacterized protein G01um101416_160 [Microgenomates group bacterium Gr01-1014_16]|nr:MAG: Uncharacterized protein G01um101416_160 [Microgenomates group bacterium Gr01-1014_16]